MMSNDVRTECEPPVYSLRLDEFDLKHEMLLEQARRAIREKCREVVELRRVVLASTSPQLITTGQTLARAFARQAMLFAFGNGASSTDAQDLVTDLLHPPFPHWRALPALALHNTAAGDGAELEDVFTQQISALGRAGDIAVAFSRGGAERNVLAALAQARSQGMLTVALLSTDTDASRHAPGVDFCFAVPGEHALRVQEVQATLYHTLLEVVHACIESRPPTRERRSIHAMREKRAFLLDMR